MILVHGLLVLAIGAEKVLREGDQRDSPIEQLLSTHVTLVARLTVQRRHRRHGLSKRALLDATGPIIFGEGVEELLDRCPM